MIKVNKKINQKKTLRNLMAEQITMKLEIVIGNLLKFMLK